MKEEDRVVKQCGETQKGALSRPFWLATLQLAEELIQLRDDLENLFKGIVERDTLTRPATPKRRPSRSR